ncbi:hypothetical protein KIPB_010156 [Kipferlia bialata]|uniref:Uncharacterized protein n=1 Tax=Kipferlia bialata TaxID=797122 RepID=A0A9K3D5C2_9EUKA|nr:hypothetical protein KIPB_010156 [Kipferlia bialata]|eukprot:g10156.t1
MIRHYGNSEASYRLMCMKERAIVHDERLRRLLPKFIREESMHVLSVGAFFSDTYVEDFYCTKAESRTLHRRIPVPVKRRRGKTRRKKERTKRAGATGMRLRYSSRRGKWH